MKKDNTATFVRKVLKKLNIKSSPKMENLFIQIFKFCIVGGTASIIDFGLLYIFRDICKLDILIANTLSFCISVIYNYIASTKWVFDINKEKDAKRQFIIFIVFSIIGLLINNLIMWIASDKLHIYYLLSKVIATLIVMVFNFITRKLFLE